MPKRLMPHRSDGTPAVQVQGGAIAVQVMPRHRLKFRFMVCWRVAENPLAETSMDRQLRQLKRCFVLLCKLLTAIAFTLAILALLRDLRLYDVIVHESVVNWTCAMGDLRP